uniref:Uncharacterized protein n=1 Tax=Anguilla anguilla TaxID=7936 RepID=A0A0E9WC02_ANGAN
MSNFSKANLCETCCFLQCKELPSDNTFFQTEFLTKVALRSDACWAMECR